MKACFAHLGTLVCALSILEAIDREAAGRVLPPQHCIDVVIGSSHRNPVSGVATQETSEFSRNLQPSLDR